MAVSAVLNDPLIRISLIQCKIHTTTQLKNDDVFLVAAYGDEFSRFRAASVARIRGTKQKWPQNRTAPQMSLPH